MAFKDRLKEARLKQGYTQEQIAEKIGIAKSTFTGYEKGNSEPNMLTVSKIMDILHIDANFLYQDEMGSNYPMKVSYDEYQHIKKYRDLDEHGKRMVDFTLKEEYERSVAEKKKSNNIVPMTFKETSDYKTDAAHSISGASSEDQKYDDDIMDSDNF